MSACVITANWFVPATPWLPSLSFQEPATKLTVTLPVSRLPVYR